MKKTSLTILSASTLFVCSAQAATVYNIDIDASGTDYLKSGYTRLVSPFTGSGGSVTIDGDTFTLFGQAGARARGLGNATNIDGVNRDFAFIEGGAGGVELGMQLGSAGGLEAGTWELSVYSWDSDVPVEGQIVGIYTDNGAVSEIIYGASVDKSSTGPAVTFQFVSDGTSAYSLFIRDSAANPSAGTDSTDKIRFNGIDLVYIPEPSSLGLLGIGGLLLLKRRR